MKRIRIRRNEADPSGSRSTFVKRIQIQRNETDSRGAGSAAQHLLLFFVIYLIFLCRVVALERELSLLSREFVIAGAGTESLPPDTGMNDFEGGKGVGMKRDQSRR